MRSLERRGVSHARDGSLAIRVEPRAACQECARARGPSGVVDVEATELHIQLMARKDRYDLASAALQISQECIAMRVRRLGRTVTRIFDDALRPLGLGIAQLTMLVAIARAGTFRPSELGRVLDLEKSTVTRNLTRMLAYGWIRSMPEPGGNGYRVELEPAGRALLERAYPAWSAAQEQAKRELGEALENAMRKVSVGGL